MGRRPAVGGMGEKMIKDVSLPQFYKNKKVLVTGHTGFKGAWLVEILTRWGAKVSAVAQPPHTAPDLFTVLQHEKKIHHHLADVRNLESLLDIFRRQQPEIVFHLAAQAIVKTSYEDPLRTYETNIMGTANILQAARVSPSVKSVVTITSDKAYLNVEWVYPYREIDALGGHDPYSCSKAAADIIAQSMTESFLSSEDSPRVGIARAGNVIGGGDWSSYRIVPDFVRSVYEEGSPMVMRSPNSIRPWQHVLEPLSGYLLLAKKLYEGNRSLATQWNFGPADVNFVTVEDLVKTGIDILGRGKYEIVPDKNLKEANLLKLDISKAKTLLGWRPRLNLADTLEFTFSWYKHFYEKTGDISQFTGRQIETYFNKPVL